MTNVQYHIQQMEKMFGQLPSPKHEPKRFEYYVKLYKFYTNRV